MAKKKKYKKAKSYPILKNPKKDVKYFSVPQVAKRLRVSLPTVYTWVARGLFKGTCKDKSGHWMIPAEELVKPVVPEWHFSSPKAKRKKANEKRKKDSKKAQRLRTSIITSIAG